MAIAALLFVFPAVFAGALRLKKLPQSARDAVCGKFTEPVFYWGAVTLFFRLLVSVTQFLRVDFPNILAFVRSSLSTGVFFLLVNLRPYVDERTFWVDVVCYGCLIAQFGLQIFSADREFLGVAETLDKNVRFSKDISTLSTVVRWGPLLAACADVPADVCRPLQVCSRCCVCRRNAEGQVSFRQPGQGHGHTHRTFGAKKRASSRSMVAEGRALHRQKGAAAA